MIPLRLAMVLSLVVSLTSGVAAAPGEREEKPEIDRGFDFRLTDAELAAHPVVNADFDAAAGEGDIPGWKTADEGLVRLTAEGIGGSKAARIELAVRSAGEARAPSLTYDSTTAPERTGEAAGRLMQELDVAAFAGQKMFLHARVRIEGGAAPYFRIDSLDGEKGRLAQGSGFKATTVLGEFQRFGYWYDFRYGWPVNPHMTLLYREGWQDVGTIFTIPQGVRRVLLTFEARGVKYGLIERRDVLPRRGAVVIDSVRMGRVKENGASVAAADAAEAWSAQTLEPKAFFFLSYIYNQQLIRAAATEQELWRATSLERYARAAGIDTSPYPARIAEAAARIDEAQARLAGLRAFYEANAAVMLATADLSEVAREYPLQSVQGFGSSDSVASPQLHLSVWIETMVREGFTVEHPLVEELRAAVDRAEAGTRALADELVDAMGAAPAPDTPDTLGSPEAEPLLPKDGHAPHIAFSTGNTGFPYRVYKDLGVDAVSINYYNDDEKGIEERRSISRMLRELGLKQISALFSPVHYQLAVSNEFMEENADRLDEVLRYDEAGLSPFVTRHRKTSQKKNVRLPLDDFKVDPELRYYVPINPLSPRGAAHMDDRVEAIKNHAAGPENAGVIAALELSAEAVSLVSPGGDPWIKAAYAEFLKKKFRSVAAMNSTLETSFGSLEEAADTPTDELAGVQAVRMKRLEQEFTLLTDARIHAATREKLAAAHPDLTVLHRNNDMFFSDFAYGRASIKDDYLDYHAGYDRAYGYYLGRALGIDHIIGEDNISGPTGLRERETAPITQAKLLRTTWRFAAWGTKSICIWRMYREPLLVSAASDASHYTLINENFALLPYLKNVTRRFAPELDGEVAPPATTILQLRQQGHTTWYMPSVYNVAQFLRQRHVDYAYSFESAIEEGKDSLDRYRLVIVPPSLFVSEKMQRDLSLWVQGGGTLVTFGPLGQYDEHARPAGWLLEQVFGTGSFHLIGSTARLRAYDGYWLARLKDKAGVRAVPFPGDVPREVEGKLLEKQYNDPKMLASFKPATGELQPDQHLYVSDYGEGRVIMVPSEYLPNSATAALWQLIDEAAGDLSSVSVDDPDISVMLRRRHGAEDAAGWRLFVQHENEWAGPREAMVTIRGEHGSVTDVTGERAVPVAAEVEGERTAFKVHLYPGQLAVFHVKP